MEDLPDNILRIAQHDDTAFKKLYDYYSPFIWRVAFRTVHGRDDLAKTIVQNVFVIAFRKLGKFKGNSSFSTWLYSIAWRESLRILKKEKKSRDRHSELTGNETYIDNENDVSVELEKVLSILTEEERFLLISKEIDGFSFDDLAEITGRSNGSLRTALSRIKNRLKEEV